MAAGTGDGETILLEPIEETKDTKDGKVSLEKKDEKDDSSMGSYLVSFSSSSPPPTVRHGTIFY